MPDARVRIARCCLAVELGSCNRILRAYADGTPHLGFQSRREERPASPCSTPLHGSIAGLMIEPLGPIIFRTSSLQRTPPNRSLSDGCQMGAFRS